MVEEKIKVNYHALFVIVIYPIILAIFAIIYSSRYGIGKFEVISLVVTYYVVNVSVGVGLHRLWSHGAFRTKKWVELILAFITAGALQGPILAWASDHMIHHQYTDTEKDPHTALKYKNQFMGFLWSHMGWMIFSDLRHKKIDRLALVKLGKNKVVLWQFRHYWKIAIFMNTVIPLIIGLVIGGNIKYAIGAFLFMGLGRAIQQQATFCVNSIVHTNIGTKKYYYGTATDIWWLFFILLGENWHNFHHAFANDYRNGHKWYHLDIHKWIIKLMAKLGIASNLVVTSNIRIKSMKEEVRKKVIANLQRKLDSIEKATQYIHSLALNKLKIAENSTMKLAYNLKNNLNTTVIKAISILKYIQSLKLDTNNLEERFILRLCNKYNDLRKTARVLEMQIDAL